MYSKPSSLAVSLALAIILSVLMSREIQAQNFTVIHSFTGGNDGANPIAGLTADGAGNLYGTAADGGALGTGTVFRLDYSYHNWLFYLLYTFHGLDDLRDGSFPYARVVIGPDGFLYGTTHSGGDGQGCEEWHGCGTVFLLKPGKTISSWDESILHRFGIADGSNPDYGDVVFDHTGNLYGTTRNGGAYQQGTVYELKRTGAYWTESVLYSFGGSPDGASPSSGPVFDQAGRLYGTTSAGGTDGWGTVYQLQSSGSGWTEDVLHSFQNGSDGMLPTSGATFDQAGNLYGATQAGGMGGGGTVFELTPLFNDNWNFVALFGFPGAGFGGSFRTLVADNAGNLYGTSAADGAYHAGSVFKLTRSIGGWTYSSLHDFTGGTDGGTPFGSLTLGANGNLYGTAYSGGAYGYGVVWEMTP